MRVGKVLLVLGVLIIGLVLVAGSMSYVGGAAGIDRDSPPVPGASTASSAPPPATSMWASPPTVSTCMWGWKGGRFTVELWHDGDRVRRWVLPIALTPGVPSGGGGWDVQGSVDFTVNSCGNEFYYEVLVLATVEFREAVEPTVTPTSTGTVTWAPPPPPGPPGKPPVVPISIMGSGMNYELYGGNGTSYGHVKVFWYASLSRVFRTLPDGEYDVKVWCQVNYVSVDGAHRLTKYSDAVDLGTFKVVGGKVSYEG